MKFKKGVMRKRWIDGKEAAKKACVTKGEAVYLGTYSQDDFGPKLDDVEDLYPKKATKVKEYAKAWEAAHKVCKSMRDRAREAGISQMNIAMQKALLDALNDILKCLESADVKPA